MKYLIILLVAMSAACNQAVQYRKYDTETVCFCEDDNGKMDKCPTTYTLVWVKRCP